MVDIFLAVGIAYLFGIGTYFWGKTSAVQPTIESLMTILEKGNYIKVRIAKDGEKELVPLNEGN